MKILELNSQINKLANKKDLLTKRVEIGLLPIIISMFGFGLAMVFASPLFLIGVGVDIILGSSVQLVEKHFMKKYDNKIKDLRVEIQAEHETSEMSVEKINERIDNYSKELDKSKHWITVLTNERNEATSRPKKQALKEVISENKANLIEQERYLSKMIEIRNKKENSLNN